jgi:hypothetical protein
MYFLVIFRSILLRMRHISDKLCRENRAVYEIMWKNVVEPDRSQTTIWRIFSACWKTKVTNTHSAYVILIKFALQQLLQEC